MPGAPIGWRSRSSLNGDYIAVAAAGRKRFEIVPPLTQVRAFDEAIFRWINGWPDSCAPFFVFLSEGNKESLVRVGLCLLVLAMLVAGPRTRRTALLALVAWGLANGLTEGLKEGLGVLRPCTELADVSLRVNALTSPGTASSHAASMAAVAFVFAAGFGWLGAPWGALALLVGLSRIYVGVHYPSQVVLGWLCGLVCGLIAVKTWDAFVRTRLRGKVVGPIDETAADPNAI